MTAGESVWQWFGFRKNPYDFRALGVNKEDRGLFVGREKELPRLALPIASDDGGITVVEGRVGVGKTSFVNAVQYDKWVEGHSLPSFQVLQVQRNTDPIGFILSAFSTCIGSLELSNPGAAAPVVTSSVLGWCQILAPPLIGLWTIVVGIKLYHHSSQFALLEGTTHSAEQTAGIER